MKKTAIDSKGMLGYLMRSNTKFLMSAVMMFQVTAMVLISVKGGGINVAALVLAVLQAKLDMLELVKANETAQDCGSWIVTGTMTPAMQAKSATYAAPADRFAAAVMRAMGAGEKSAVETSAVTADDWQAIATQFVASGGTAAELKSLAAGAQDPRACEVNQKFLKVLADAPGVSGQRMRAETVRAFVLTGSS